MGTVRTFGGTVVTTHYFSTKYEVNKYVGPDRTEGWYYQVGIGPHAVMRGPFKLLTDVAKDLGA